MGKKKGRWTVTEQATPLLADEKSVELQEGRHGTAGIVKEMIVILTSTGSGVRESWE